MLRFFLILPFLAAAATSALADVSAQQFVEKEIVTRDNDGKDRIERIKAEKVTPGEEVIYALRFSNDGDAPADAVILVMPVPAEVSYVEGSVDGEDAKITFSADGGQTYVARGRLTVSEDGEERPAKSNEITHIKWALNAPMPAKQQAEVSYHAVLK